MHPSLADQLHACMALDTAEAGRYRAHVRMTRIAQYHKHYAPANAEEQSLMCKIAYLATLPMTRDAARDAWGAVAPALSPSEAAHFKHLVLFARTDLCIEEEGSLASEAEWDAWIRSM
tara:strand:+ start:124 stop:477 length:354 start_codon:yes stop_codon:yes gene_type:complete